MADIRLLIGLILSLLISSLLISLVIDGTYIDFNPDTSSVNLDFIDTLINVLIWYTDSTGNLIADAFINLLIKIQQFGIIAIIITIVRGN